MLSNWRHFLVGNAFLKSSFYSSISVLVKIATAFITAKFIAVYLGPSGLGLLGQVTNLVSISTLFAGGILVNAVIKLVAESNKNSEQSLAPLVQTISSLSLLLSSAVAIILFVFSNSISRTFLYSLQYSSAVKVLSFSIFLVSFNTITLAVLNGLKDFKTYNYLNASINILGLIGTLVLISLFGVTGAVYGTILSQAFGFLLVILAVRKKDWLLLNFKKPVFDRAILLTVLKLTLMMVVTALTTPVVQLAVRNHLIATQNISNAGIWEAVNKISGVHLLFFLTVLTTYYLPRLSELTDKFAVKVEIIKGYKLLTPLILVSSTCLFLTKDFVINLLYTKDFITAASIMSWQIVGDFFKISSFLLAFIMIAKSLSTTYIVSEIISSVSYYFLVVFFTNRLGIGGATLAYGITYIGYFLFLIIRFRKLLLYKSEDFNTGSRIF
ncbi:MAG: O-antigen translocase [Bacteroidetes bacterium]|nr:MAG: O-antigen translocase [Bacteroidota bacterium]